MPVLVAEDGLVVSGGTVIAEYIEETEPASATDLLWGEAPMRAEIRRLVHWFEFKFNREVCGPLVAERVIKRFSGSGELSSSVIRAALINLNIHMDYIDWLTEQGNWLAGKRLSLADLAAAAHLSVLDFLGDVDWGRHPEAKNWYAKMKSRPLFVISWAIKSLAWCHQRITPIWIFKQVLTRPSSDCGAGIGDKRNKIIKNTLQTG